MCFAIDVLNFAKKWIITSLLLKEKKIKHHDILEHSNRRWVRHTIINTASVLNESRTIGLIPFGIFSLPSSLAKIHVTPENKLFLYGYQHEVNYDIYPLVLITESSSSLGHVGL